LLSYLSFAKALARQAGTLVKANLERCVQSGSWATVYEKNGNPSDFVTETDEAVEDLIRSHISAAYPHHSFIGEESCASGSGPRNTLDDTPTWIVDPIDGTANFIHGYPFIAISIGLAIDRMPILGVIYNPILDELYSALRGHGAFLNDTTRLPLIKPPPPLIALSQCLIMTELGSTRTSDILSLKIDTVHNFMASPLDPGTRSHPKSTPHAARVHALRSTGSAALNLCMLSKGVADVYWEVGCWEWDVAAGLVILQEVGGMVVSGGKNDKIDEGPVDIFGRKFLAVRGASTKEEQIKILEECREVIEDVEYSK
jgi:myo-inositol-1(or 4)-monophosphatase